MAIASSRPQYRTTPKASLVQRKVARRSRDGGIADANCVSFVSPAGGAFCKGLNCAPARRGIVCGRLSAGQGLLQGLISTARRGGLPFAPAKGSKTGQRGTKLSPLQTPLTLSCAGYEYCFSLNNREKQIRTAHRCAPKVATAYLPPPCSPPPLRGRGRLSQLLLVQLIVLAA